MSQHHLLVDWTRCDGHGLCAELLPHRISRDEWGFPIVAGRPVAPAELRPTRRAVALCPALALRLAGTRIDREER
jgi:ferredoxin